MSRKGGMRIEVGVSKLMLVAVIALFMSTAVFAQVFSTGNLVVVVEGCGINGGTCQSVPNGTGNGTGNSSVGGYGDNQAAPLKLFQYTPSGSFVSSLVLPQASFGANLPVSGEYGSSSEGTLQLSGGNGYYLTLMGYGINAAAFDADYYQCAPSQTCPLSGDPYGAAPSGALAQSGSLTGQSYTPVARVLALIDVFGNVNSSTALFNVFDTNNPRSAYTPDGTSVFYVSGQGDTQGTPDPDNTGGVFYSSIGAVNNAPTPITDTDTENKAGNGPAGQDARDVQIYNGTLYISVDSKEGTGNNRDFIGTLGSSPTGPFGTPNAMTGVYPGPTQLSGFGTSNAGKLTITTGTHTNGNPLNNSTSNTGSSNTAANKINLSPMNYFFASSTVLYVADSGDPKNDSNGDTNDAPSGASNSTNLGDGGLQKWRNVSGTWTLEYTMYNGLNLVNNGSGTGTSGLYGLTGSVNGDTVSLYATNYTLSDLDPTYLYGITDSLSNTAAPSTASPVTFTLLATAPSDSNFKGVSLAPAFATPTTVTSDFSITGSGLAYSRSLKQFIGSVTIENTSGSTINGPLDIAFTSLPAGVTLVNATGTYLGSPYISVPVSSLMSGQAATVGVQFGDPSMTGISMSPSSLVIYEAF